MGSGGSSSCPPSSSSGSLPGGFSRSKATRSRLCCIAWLNSSSQTQVASRSYSCWHFQSNFRSTQRSGGHLESRLGGVGSSLSWTWRWRSSTSRRSSQWSRPPRWSSDESKTGEGDYSGWKKSMVMVQRRQIHWNWNAKPIMPWKKNNHSIAPKRIPSLRSNSGWGGAWFGNYTFNDVVKVLKMCKQI